MAAPKLPARPALELGQPKPPTVLPNGVRLSNVAVIQPGDRDLYRVSSDFMTGSKLGNICTSPKGR